MNDEPLVSVCFERIAAPARAAWAAGLNLRLPAGVAAALAPDGAGDLGEAAATFGRDRLAAAATALRERAAFTAARPASSRLPISYHYIPAPLRMAAARLIGRRRRRQVDRWAAFPGWPLDLSADFLADLAADPGEAPPTGPTPVLLTHDLDSPEGLRNLIARFLDIEEAAGARSADYVVPCAWPIDHGLLEEARARGHEIGVHGYDHANRTPFAAPEERRRRLDAPRPLVERYGVAGYRAPSLLRSPALLDDLNGRYLYDSSVPTSGGLFPVPNNGCASARPFRLRGMWEIPITLPRDGSLLFLGHGAAEILSMWRDCADRIARAGGVVCLLTHCEDRFSGGAEMLGIYRRFVEETAADPRFVFTTPAALAQGLEDARRAGGRRAGVTLPGYGVR
jgi:peptidoglycan/xylan/chitin deacetylase (PgdA/CDA1 family)